MMFMDNVKYKIIRSDRKTCSIDLRPNNMVIVRAPKSMTDFEIKAMIIEHESWITKNFEKLNKKIEIADTMPKIDEEMISELTKQALEYIPKRVEYYAKIIGVTYKRLTIKCLKTRWGSCSSMGNINFNCLIMLAPDDVIDYLVVHELCHRKQMDHSKKFWNEVEKILPDYEASKAWLKTKGSMIIMNAFSKK